VSKVRRSIKVPRSNSANLEFQKQFSPPSTSLSKKLHAHESRHDAPDTGSSRMLCFLVHWTPRKDLVEKWSKDPAEFWLPHLQIYWQYPARLPPNRPRPIPQHTVPPATRVYATAGTTRMLANSCTARVQKDILNDCYHLEVKEVVIKYLFSSKKSHNSRRLT
jgi:hypothetical protein